MVKGSNNPARRRDLMQLLLGILVLALLNFIGSNWFFRLDLTTEKKHTLSSHTKELLENLDDVVFFRVYLKGDDFPAGFDRLRNATKEMLDEFRIYSDNNVEYEFINPIEGISQKEQADVFTQLYQKGITPAILEVKEKGGTSQQTIFPGAIAIYQGRETGVQLFKEQLGIPSEVVLNNSLQGMEYELSNAIRKLQTVLKPKVAFLEGHGELDSLQVADITGSLGEYYVVERLDLQSKLKNLEKIKEYDAVIIAKPDSIFSEQDKFILDQYIMNGGKAIFFLDPVYASIDSLQNAEFTYGIPNKINLDDMLFNYGVRVNYNLVQDMNSGLIPIPISGKYQMFPWLFFPLLNQGSDHPIAKNLNAVRAQFASTIDTIVTPRIRKKILLSTSKYSNIMTTPVYITLRGVSRPPNEKQFNKGNIPIAVLLEGTFESLYRNQPMGILDSIIGFKRLKESKPTSIIVCGDGDLIANKIQPSNGMALPLGYDVWTKETFGNKNFVLNAINHLCDDSGLLSVRSREVVLRVLDRKKAEAGRTKWQILNTVLPLGIIIILGLIVFFIRRKRYAS